VFGLGGLVFGLRAKVGELKIALLPLFSGFEANGQTEGYP
jgi:hypothetical protein